MKSLGLYLHIPFCRSKCLYCDFCSFPRPRAETVSQYVRALCADLTRRAPECKAYTVDTVFFGGGTPTVLPAGELCELLNTVAMHYRLAPDAEICAECNPATADKAYFAEMLRVGFNRLSIGLQSTHEDELRALGRLHDLDGFVRTFAQAREAGFANIGADLMMGIPHQTPESYLASVERLAALAPEHISAYCLSVEKETPFGRMGDRLLLPDEESTRKMYFSGTQALAAHGYAQYEISNFARKGYRSRHNLKYWSCEEYLGFGPAAYSDFGGARFGNSRDLDAYLRGEAIEAERETPDVAERVREYIMLRLRLCEGIDPAAFARRFGIPLPARVRERLEELSRHGLATVAPERLALTPEGFYVSNPILADLLERCDECV